MKGTSVGIFFLLQKAIEIFVLETTSPFRDPQGLMAPSSMDRDGSGIIEIQIHLNGAAKSPAGLAGADRAVERKEIGDGGSVSDVDRSAHSRLLLKAR